MCDHPPLTLLREVFLKKLYTEISGIKGKFTDPVGFFRGVLARREITPVLAKPAFDALKIYDATIEKDGHLFSSAPCSFLFITHCMSSANSLSDAQPFNAFMESHQTILLHRQSRARNRRHRSLRLQLKQDDFVTHNLRTPYFFGGFFAF
ncbi:hypothetical protein B0H13DRAFT_2335965 [Mycena leptocephala]|nr:hypothetical protein B0H13DRAFT_2335965 [Mycena leptocephala]